ncbi:MAG: LacI family DNA-binding transcriptional regulator, partial [Alphaproteobacteria bacterium]
MSDRKKEKTVTLDDIALAAGVSRTTASNAFNRPDQLSAAKRNSIMEIAAGLNYPGPNPLARKLRSGRAGAIGVVFGDSLSYAFSDSAAIAFLLGVGQACQDAGQSLLLIPTDAKSAAQATISDAIVDGFIVYTTPNEAAVAQVLVRNLPVVSVDRQPIPGCASVRIEDRLGARAAAAHILSLGHENIAVVVPRLHPEPHSGPVDSGQFDQLNYVVCADRLAGYLEAVAAAGLNVEDVVIEERPTNSEEAGYDAAFEVLTHKPRPTAILAMSDRMAIGAMRAAEALGLKVPGDLSIVGFDDIPAAESARPPLTTVCQPLVEKGL